MWVQNKLSPSDFWNLTMTEWWWWFETVIPEHVTERSELSQKLKAAKEIEKCQLNLQI
tara:strand:+ start:121 stop:294 length:174 start_codon:yes stop_codon:yes gene_type:complete